MNRVAWLVLGALLVTGCGSSEGSGARSEPVADGNYEVGQDIAAGVYTAERGCVGTIASSPGYDILTAGADDGYLGGSLRVGDRQRVSLAAGTYFTSQDCSGGWVIEDGSTTPTPDPATRAGACQILLGTDALVDEAVDVLVRAASGAEDRRLYDVQERLMAVVFSRTKVIWRHAGELVDFLDAPDAFVSEGKPEPRVEREVAAIRRTCA